MLTTDQGLARFNMVEQQIRPWEVLDPRILSVFDVVPRDYFVPSGQLSLAFAEIEIDIGYNQKMLIPSLEGKILQALAPEAGETALEVGTGSGFSTTLLSKLAKQVYSVELRPELAEAAKKRLAALGITNALVEQGDALKGWGGHAPYDIIVLSGAVATVPPALLANLQIGGRLFAMVGSAPMMVASLFIRSATGYSSKELFDVCAPSLIGGGPTAAFRF